MPASAPPSYYPPACRRRRRRDLLPVPSRRRRRRVLLRDRRRRRRPWAPSRCCSSWPGTSLLGRRYYAYSQLLDLHLVRLLFRRRLDLIAP